MISQRMYIVLLDGPDVHFLGGSARARNARVIDRVSAVQRPLGDLAGYGSHPSMLVPPHVALTPALFNDRTFEEAVRESSPSCLQTVTGASVIVGAASLVAGLAHDRAAQATLPRRAVPNNTLLDITTARARRLATRTVLQSTQKATDGWVSRRINRPVSRLCSRVAIQLGVGAHTASMLTLLAGFACAWMAAQPGYRAFVMAGILFQLASMLDGVDGEIARATLTESAWGARIDTAVDQTTYAAGFVGTTIGWAREGGAWPALQWTTAVAIVLVLSLIRGARFVARHGENASFVVIDRSVRRAARDTNAWPLRVAAGAFALLRRDMFAMLFLAVSLTGLRVLVPVMLLAGSAIANATLSLYGQELADAAHAERRKPSAVHAGS
jgi:phosphatidylglycerophosphate synthase